MMGRTGYTACLASGASSGAVLALSVAWAPVGVVSFRGPMAQFDPRRQPMRLAPHALTAVAALSVALLAGRVYQPAKAEEVPALTPAQMAVIEAKAFAAAGTPAGLTAPEAIPVQIRRGETF